MEKLKQANYLIAEHCRDLVHLTEIVAAILNDPELMHKQEEKEC